MKITSSGATNRNQWYDRNPLNVTAGSANPGVVPHANTNRFSYTVPTGRKCLVAHLWSYLDRATVATTIGEHSTYIQITPNGGSAKEIARTYIEGSNAIDANRQVLSNSQMLLSAGDLIVGGDMDSSTGGSLSVAAGFAATEFDA